MHALFVGEILGGGERAARRDDALDRRRIRERQEHDDAGKDARFFEGVDEEPRDVVLDAHAGEHHDELFVGGEYLRLADDLGGEPVVRQAVPRKYRQLLAADQGVHAVDGRNARLDEVARILAGIGVDRIAVHVDELRRIHFGIAVDGLAESVEHAAHEPFGDAQLHRPLEEFDGRVVEAEARGRPENLHDAVFLADVDDPTRAESTRSVADGGDLAVKDVAAPLHYDDGSVDRCDAPVFYAFHAVSTLRYIRSSSSSCAFMRISAAAIPAISLFSKVVLIRMISSRHGRETIFTSGAPFRMIASVRR